MWYVVPGVTDKNLRGEKGKVSIVRDQLSGTKPASFITYGCICMYVYIDI
jgi:hypothetical protein